MFFISDYFGTKVPKSKVTSKSKVTTLTFELAVSRHQFCDFEGSATSIFRISVKRQRQLLAYYWHRIQTKFLLPGLRDFNFPCWRVQTAPSPLQENLRSSPFFWLASMERSHAKISFWSTFSWQLTRFQTSSHVCFNFPSDSQFMKLKTTLCLSNRPLYME